MTPLTRLVLSAVRTVRWRHRIIAAKSPLGPYMCRIWLTPDRKWWRRRFPGLFLQYFYRGDSDRFLHNHPWVWARSLILSGGYIETRPEAKYEYRPGSRNRLLRDTFHKVELLDPARGCWTLFLAGPGIKRDWKGNATGDWGFLQPDGTVRFWKEVVGDGDDEDA